jgi:hypothetical protein
MDIPLVGNSFTWSSSRDPPSWFIIHRFLVTPNLESQFLDLLQKRLSRLSSYHLTILLDCGGIP